MRRGIVLPGDPDYEGTLNAVNRGEQVDTILNQRVPIVGQGTTTPKTPSLRVFHISDTHSVDPENDPYLSAVENHIATRQSGDEATRYHAMTTPGDFLELTPRGEAGTISRAFEKIARRVGDILQQEEHQTALSSLRDAAKAEFDEIVRVNGITETTRGEDLDPKVLAKIQKLSEPEQEYVTKIQQEVTETMIGSREYTLDDLLGVIETDYAAIGERFKRIKDSGIEILAVPGNHDTQAVYGLDVDNGGPFTFVDRRKAVTLNGYDGTEFTIQGDLNSFEVPAMLSQFIQQLVAHKDETRTPGDIYLDYNSGLCLNATNRPEYERGIDNLVLAVGNTKQRAEEVKASQQVARDRLGDVGQADIYLAHKVTGYAGMGTGDVAAEYSANSATVLAGHEHQLQIGKIRGEQALIDEIRLTNETEMVDGNEVNVFYFDGDEPLQLNAGRNMALEVVYNTGKEVEEVIVYAMVEKRAA